MTASRIRRSRSFRSGSGISLKVLTTSGVSQVSGQGVQSQPAAWGQPKSVGVTSSPALFDPGADQCLVRRVDQGAIGGPQLEVGALGQSIVGRQPLFTGRRIAAHAKHAEPGRVLGRVPAACRLAIELMRRRAEPRVRDARPIRRVMTGPRSGPGEIGDLVVLKAGGNGDLMGEEKLRLVYVLACLIHLAALYPAR